jgi:hypothetical protein
VKTCQPPPSPPAGRTSHNRDNGRPQRPRVHERHGVPVPDKHRDSGGLTRTDLAALNQALRRNINSARGYQRPIDLAAEHLTKQ